VGVRLLLPSQGPALSLVMWSLFVEMTFYALLPLIARLARGREWLVIGGLGVGSLMAAVSTPGETIPIILDPVLMPVFFWAFSVGMLLAILERDRPKLIRGQIWLAVGLPLIAIGLLIADSYPAGFSDPAASLLVVLGAVAVMGALMGRRQRWTWMALGADATYSFYLWHLPVLSTLAPVVIAPATLVLGFLITGLVSVATTMIFERPIRRWAAARIASRAGRGDILAAVLPQNPDPG
jgi:peptidoglycan/LPS O-acetylase OafA/YrhL